MAETHEIHPDEMRSIEAGVAEGRLMGIVPGKTDAEKAAAYRAEMLPVLKQVCDIIQRSRADGLSIGWDNIGMDQFGRTIVPPINVTKAL